MNINLSVSAAPGISGYLIVAAYETANPNVVVAYEVLPRPLVADVNVTLIGLNAVVHNVFIWENTTPVVGGTIKNKFVYDPEYSNATVEVRLDLFLTVGAGGENPVAGTESFTRADLDGWEYGVERRGFGTMEPGVDVDVIDNGQTITLIKEVGGYSDVFGEGEVFCLHFVPKVITNAPIETFNSGRIFSGTELIEDDRTLDASDIGKAFRLSGTLTVTLPALNTVPQNRHMAFIAEGPSHNIATIQCAGSDTIEWLGGSKTKIHLLKCERLWIYSVAGVWVVSVADGNFKTVGEVFMSYSMSDINAAFCAGQLLDRELYARLWEYVQTLDSSMLVSDANWNNVALNNKGRFSVGDGVTNFRLPLLHAPGFVRAVDGSSRLAGSYQAEMVGPHTHPAKRTRTDTVGTRYENNSIRQGGDRGLWTGDDITIAAQAGVTENRPAQVGMYFSIRC